MPSCGIVLLSQQKRLFVVPFAPPTFTGFLTTMRRSDFWPPVGFSPFTRLQSPLPLSRRRSDLPGTLVIPCALATLCRPRRNLLGLAYRPTLAACDSKESIGFRSLLLTGLNRFTLSHCGSHTPLPTLKPDLTTKAPRLCTGCPLRLCRARTLTELHYKRRTGAPFLCDYTMFTIPLSPLVRFPGAIIEQARALLAKEMPEREWTFDD